MTRPRDPNDPEAWDAVNERLRIRFLFPGITQAARDCLLNASRAQFRLRQAQLSYEKERSPDEGLGAALSAETFEVGINNDLAQKWLAPDGDFHRTFERLNPGQQEIIVEKDLNPTER